MNNTGVRNVFKLLGTYAEITADGTIGTTEFELLPAGVRARLHSVVWCPFPRAGNQFGNPNSSSIQMKNGSGGTVFYESGFWANATGNGLLHWNDFPAEAGYLPIPPNGILFTDGIFGQGVSSEGGGVVAVSITYQGA